MADNPANQNLEGPPLNDGNTPAVEDVNSILKKYITNCEYVGGFLDSLTEVPPDIHKRAKELLDEWESFVSDLVSRTEGTGSKQNGTVQRTPKELLDELETVATCLRRNLKKIEAGTLDSLIKEKAKKAQGFIDKAGAKLSKASSAIIQLIKKHESREKLKDSAETENDNDVQYLFPIVWIKEETISTEENQATSGHLHEKVPAASASGNANVLLPVYNPARVKTEPLAEEEDSETHHAGQQPNETENGSRDDPAPVVPPAPLIPINPLNPADLAIGNESLEMRKLADLEHNRLDETVNYGGGSDDQVMLSDDETEDQAIEEQEEQMQLVNMREEENDVPATLTDDDGQVAESTIQSLQQQLAPVNFPTAASSSSDETMVPQLTNAKKAKKRPREIAHQQGMSATDDGPPNKIDDSQAQLIAQRQSLKPFAAKLFVSAALRFIPDERITQCGTLQLIAGEVEEICGASLVCSLDNDLPGNPSDFRGIGQELTELVMPSYSLKSTKKTIRKLSAKHHPRFAISAVPFMDFRTATGQEVIAAAKRGPGVVCSTNLNKMLFFCFPKEKLLVETEKKHMASNGVAEHPTVLTKKATDYLPCLQFEVNDLSTKNLEKFHHLMGTATSFLLKNMNAVCNIPLDDITFEKVFALGGDLTVEVLRGMAQPTSSNCSYDFVDNDRKWTTINYKHKIRLSEFEKHYHDVIKISKDACRAIYEDPTQKDKVLEELPEKLHNVVVPIPEIGNPEVYLPVFATNLGLNRRRFKSLNILLERLPEIFRPNNKFDILNVVNYKMDGLNVPQLYLKFPSSKTIFHCENGNFISINWNFGPDDVVWFMVPPEYIGEFWKMMEEENITIETADKDRNLWIDPEAVLKKKIPLQKVIQKPGDMVVVGMGTPHWVQSTGFAINVSWNLGLLTETQLEWAAMSHDRLTFIAAKPIIPLETYIWERIRLGDELGDMTPKMKDLLKSMAMKSMVKSQLELYWMERNSDFKNFKRVYGNEYKDGKAVLKNVEFCDFCKTVLHNCVLKGEDGQTRCLVCYKKTSKKGNEDVDMNDEDDSEDDVEDEENNEGGGSLREEVGEEEKMDEAEGLEHEENVELEKAEEGAMEEVQKKSKSKRNKRMKKGNQRSKKELPKITVYIRWTEQQFADRFDSLKIVT